MFSKISSAAVLALAATMASAQTHTDCNPLEKSCPADPAFGNKKVDCDFTKGSCDAFKELAGTKITYNGKGAQFKIDNPKGAPTIQSGKYIMFGRVDVEVQAAEGAGIVTSAVLQSDDLDEIDWEWVGGDNKQVQTNYFSKGDTTTYDRGKFHPVSNPLTTSHTYSIEWTKDAVNWMVDGNNVRTLTAASAKGGSAFPQTPMQIKLGTWTAGTPDKSKWTVEWAGGLTDFSKAPFNAYYKSIKIVDYAGGDSPASKGVKEYVYGDKTGTWKSIKAVAGDGSSSDNDDDDDKTSSSSAKDTTKTSTKKEESSTKAPASTTDSSETSMATPTPTPTGDETSTGTDETSSGKPTATDAPNTNGAASAGLTLGSFFLAAGAAAAQLL